MSGSKLHRKSGDLTMCAWLAAFQDSLLDVLAA